MTQQTVKPALIESELMKIWEKLSEINKTRASLFNLIVYTKLSPRVDYFRKIVQKVIEKFPCRIIFISADPDREKEYMNTSVSVVMPESGESQVACDNIDIAMAGKDYERVPFIILPHILPDLPVYLLWAEDPCFDNPLFEKLQKLATRVIFDSEASEDLSSFSKKILSYAQSEKSDIADLNWARMEGWRDLLTAHFHSPQNLEKLQKTKEIEISYNAHETEFFCHLQIQAIFLQSWLASRLGWKMQSMNREKNSIEYKYASEMGEVKVRINSDQVPEIFPGRLLSVKIINTESDEYHFFRNKQLPDQITIQISHKDVCELPYQFILGKAGVGQSLTKEITYKGTSKHFLGMLENLQMEGK